MYFYLVTFHNAPLSVFVLLLRSLVFSFLLVRLRRETNNVWNLNVCAFWSWEGYEVRIWVCVLAVLF